VRILISTWGWRSHFLPLAPLGWALRAAGHEVLVAAAPNLVAVVTAAGLPAVPVGAELDFTEVFRDQVGRVPSPAERDRPTPAGQRVVPPTVTPDGGVVRFADALVDDLVDLGRAWRPELIVYEPLNLAAALAAAALDVPGVRLLWGPDSTVELDLDAEAVLGPMAARIGLPDVDRVRVNGHLTLDPAPPPMRVVPNGPARPVRFVPYNGPAVLPDWLRRPADRPRVCLTWGTMMGGNGLADPIPLVLRALAGLDVEVVLAVDAARYDQLGTLPANVHPSRGPLALHLLLPSCQLLIHQGGAGTMMTALACGVPQLVLPRVTDQHFNARRLALTGAGEFLDLTDADPDPEPIRDRVTALPHDVHRRRAAARMRDRVAAMPSPATVVPLLETLATHRALEEITV
jgi:UDP:flavonoid glycosyltransferase YjiC (YdhE family)